MSVKVMQITLDSGVIVEKSNGCFYLVINSRMIYINDKMLSLYPDDYRSRIIRAMEMINVKEREV